MNTIHFERERFYQVTLAVIRFIYKQGMLTEKELREIDSIMLAKYRPLLGTLYI